MLKVWVCVSQVMLGHVSLFQSAPPESHFLLVFGRANGNKKCETSVASPSVNQPPCWERFQERTFWTTEAGAANTQFSSFCQAQHVFVNFTAASDLRARPAVPGLRSQPSHAAPICLTSASWHISITPRGRRKPCLLIINAEHLKGILYPIKRFISLFVQVAGQTSSFCRHKKIFFA